MELPTSLARSKSGAGKIPKKTVAAAHVTATNTTSGWARASASGDQPPTGLTRRFVSVLARVEDHGDRFAPLLTLEQTLPAL